MLSSKEQAPVLAKAPHEPSGRQDRSRHREGDNPRSGRRQAGTNNTEPPQPPSGRLLTIKEVMARMRMGRSTIYRMINAGKFPPPIKNPAGVNLWPESVIEEQVRLMIERDGVKKPTKRKAPGSWKPGAKPDGPSDAKAPDDEKEPKE